MKAHWPVSLTCGSGHLVGHNFGHFANVRMAKSWTTLTVFLKSLDVPAYRYIVDRFLQVETAAIWTTLSGGKTLANKSDLHENQKSLDPHQMLALDVAYGGIRQWLVARGSSFDSSDSRLEMRPHTSVRNQPT
jgi:hypothetical protein